MYNKSEMQSLLTYKPLKLTATSRSPFSGKKSSTPSKKRMIKIFSISDSNNSTHSPLKCLPYSGIRTVLSSTSTGTNTSMILSGTSSKIQPFKNRSKTKFKALTGFSKYPKGSKPFLTLPLN